MTTTSRSRPAAASAGPALSTPPGMPTPRHLVYLLALGIASVWLLLDQATKILAEDALSAGRVINLGVLDLRLVHNQGAAFGIPGFPGLFIGVAIIVLVLVIRALPGTDRLSLAAAYGLVTGGALGNVVDRLLRPPGFPSGAVVDFLDLRWWPVFNIADVGIVVGAASITLLMVRVEREEQAAERARSAHRSVRPDTTSPRR